MTVMNILKIKKMQNSLNFQQEEQSLL